MTIKKFSYLKEGTTEPRDYEMLVMNKDEGHENGLILSYMTEEEKEKVLEITKKYEEDLKPYFKHFRNFKKNLMTNYVKEEAKKGD